MYVYVITTAIFIIVFKVLRPRRGGRSWPGRQVALHQVILLVTTGKLLVATGKEVHQVSY
jgi:hypothetical protein